MNYTFEKYTFEKYTFKKYTFEKYTFKKYTFKRYTFEKYTFEKYTFEKYTFEKYTFGEYIFEITLAIVCKNPAGRWRLNPLAMGTPSIVFPLGTLAWTRSCWITLYSANCPGQL